MTYRVVLEKHEAFESSVEVEAADADEAMRIAEQRDRDGMIAWTKVNGHVEAWEAVKCR